MTDLARWVAGLTDADVGRLIATATRYGLGLNSKDKFSEAAAAFRAALLALAPKEETPSGPSQSWLPDTFIERAYQEAQRQQIASDLIVVLSAAEASAIRRRVALPPSPGATP